MRTFDQHILELFSRGIITEKNAITYCSHRAELNRGLDRIKAERGEATTSLTDLSMEEEQEDKLRILWEMIQGYEETMIVNCPHCAKQLKLSEKIRNSVQQLGPGRKIKVKCVHCTVPFDLDENSLKQAHSGRNRGGAGPDKPAAGRKVKPPAPPGTEWLQDGSFEEKEIVEDIPRALVLMPDSSIRETVVKAATDFGYRVEQAPTPEEAIDKMRFVNYAAVFLHDNFEPGGIISGKFPPIHAGNEYVSPPLYFLCFNR